MRSLPVRVVPAALPAVVRKAIRARFVLPGLASSLRRRAAEAGVAVKDVVLAHPAGRAEPLAAVLIDPCPPEVRAAALAAVQVGERPVLVVTPREWAIVQRSAAGIGFEGADLEPRERLRACADRFLRQLPARLAAADLPGARAVATALRDELEQLGTPIHFPPVPGPAARAPELLTSTLGAFGAVFGGEAAVDPEAALPRSASAPAPRGLDRIHGLFEPLLADLPRHFATVVSGLYLAPGPWGTRRSWQLLAVVPDDAPLHVAAGLPRRLHQHLAMLDGDAIRGACGGLAAPAVVTESAMAGVLRRRLSARPLDRLGWRLHRDPLVGEDALHAAFEGPDHVRDDLRSELASLIVATASAWSRSGTGLRTTETMFGAWPAVLHLLRGGEPTDPLSAAHEVLVTSADPALARIGAAAAKLSLGDPWAADHGRPTALLRDLGPALVRLQDAAFEALG
ncbi:MAG: hypothetical protein GY898_12030 [Proteobacteria bacterium]|nr:hypothetical protein [Pseudomonadota bacterium]